MRRMIAATLVATTIFLSACASAEAENATITVQDPVISATPESASSGADSDEAVRNAGIGGLQNDYIRGVTDEFIGRLALNGKTDEEKVLEAYRELISSTWFDDPIGLDIWKYRGVQSEPPPFLENRALSPLLFGIGSCEDYAAAMTVVLRRMGFEAEYLPGLTISVKRKYVDHAWAVVKINGLWYHLDPQLEANIMKNSVIEYRYFLKSDEWMRADHLWGENWIDYGLAGDIPLSAGQIAEIRRDYTPPVCSAERAAVPREPLRRNAPPDKVSLLAELERERSAAGGKYPPDITLNILPPVFYENATPASGEPPEREQPYGRSFWSGAALALYNELERAAEGQKQGAGIELSQVVSAVDWERVKSAFLGDNPQYYWAKFEPQLLSNGTVKGFVLTLRTAGGEQELRRRGREIEAAAFAILENVPRGDRFTQAAAIHDEIIKHIRYDSAGDGEDSGSIYGGLAEGRGICDAFARSYQYLLQLRGIPCIYINGRTPWGAYHAWNAVKLDDGWYYVDTTWDRDERGGNLFHDYLFVTHDEIAAEHIPSEGQYPLLPAENPTAQNYYIKKGYSAALPKDCARDTAPAFLARLEDEPLGSEPKTVFLEIRVEDSAEGFKRTREYFAKNTFEVLNAINALARARGSDVRVVNKGRAEFNFNDATRVLTLLPQAYRENSNKDSQ